MERTYVLQLINQFFEIEQKMNDLNVKNSFERNINRIEAIWEQQSLIIKNPIGETYSESRTDCEASIVGNILSKKIITKVLKPIVYQNQDGTPQLIQKGIVIVE